jgi:branched-chain amino acid transport system substrate-binding protein
VVVLGACGSDDEGGGGSGGDGGGAQKLTIYSSLPLQGAARAQAVATVNGAKLALQEAGGKVGDFTIEYHSLDDSTAQAGGWEPGQTASNARKAITLTPYGVYAIEDDQLVFDRSVEPEL